MTTKNDAPPAKSDPVEKPAVKPAKGEPVEKPAKKPAKSAAPRYALKGKGNTVLCNKNRKQIETVQIDGPREFRIAHGGKSYEHVETLPTGEWVYAQS